jgi:hypothetical protein
MLANYKHSSLLFEKVGLVTRKKPNKRMFPKWHECHVGKPLECEALLRHLTSVYTQSGSKGLLDFYFEPSEVDKIMDNLFD